MINFQDIYNLDALDSISEELGRELPKSHENLKMVVIIPAKNESDGIKNTLNSICNQKDPHLEWIDKSSYEVLLLCHNCTDDTFDIAVKFTKENPSTHIHVLKLNSDIANTVGSARRILMNIATKRLSIDNGLIISTDADTIPDVNWLYHLKSYLNKDISLVCGLISVDLNELHGQALIFQTAKDQYLDLKTKLESHIRPNTNDPWPRHSYHWGPNMGIKKSAYVDIGGIHPLHFLEDVDLYNRVVSQGLIVKHCLNVKVKTSTRIDARCLEGFGAELRVWTEYEGVSYNVEGLEKLLVRFEIYNLIEQHFKCPSQKILKRISAISCMDVLDLTQIFKNHERYESLIITMENRLTKYEPWNYAYPNTDVLKACNDLRAYFKPKPALI